MRIHRWIILLFSFLVVYTNAQRPTCMGYDSLPILNTACKQQTNKKSCLSLPSFKTPNSTQSCVWRDYRIGSIVESQQFSSLVPNIYVSGISFLNFLCGMQMNITIPPQAKGKYGAGFRLQGGPWNSSLQSSYESPRIPLSSSGCVVGKGTKNSCSNTMIPPSGFAQDPNFNNNAYSVDFTATDPLLIKQLAVSGSVSSVDAFTVIQDSEFYLCSQPGMSLRNSTGIHDSTYFGNSAYGNWPEAQQSGYFLLTYRAYRLSNITGADWDVQVLKQLAKGIKKVPLTVMLLYDEDYVTYLSTNNETAIAPSELAINGTLCVGLRCQGSVRNLGSKSGVYRLWVSYPVYSHYIWDGSYSKARPVSTPNGKQLVDVLITPRTWNLGNATTASSKRVSASSDDGPLLKPLHTRKIIQSHNSNNYSGGGGDRGGS